jgi:hypothetical protein
VLAVVALAAFLLMRYMGTTAETVERFQEDKPLTQARLAADLATLTSFQGLVRAYQAQHGQWPPDKAAVLALAAGPPRFQCAGNDFAYDPASGALQLVVTDPGRC